MGIWLSGQHAATVLRRAAPGGRIMKGILVSIFRDADGGDCTMDGVSSNVARAILTGDGVAEVVETRPSDTILIYKDRGKTPPMCVPHEKFAQPGWSGWMFGGNFIYSSDSRFPSSQPIAIHDRQEPPKPPR